MPAIDLPALVHHIATGIGESDEPKLLDLANWHGGAAMAAAWERVASLPEPQRARAFWKWIRWMQKERKRAHAWSSLGQGPWVEALEAGDLSAVGLDAEAAASFHAMVGVTTDPAPVSAARRAQAVALAVSVFTEAEDHTVQGAILGNALRPAFDDVLAEVGSLTVFLETHVPGAHVVGTTGGDQLWQLDAEG